MRRIFLLPLFLWALPAAAAVVLQYHHVSETTPASTSVTPERFAMHLGYLAENGFRVVPLQDLVDVLRSEQPLPDRTVAITFDDGYRSIYEHAFPLLQERNWPFTVFINTRPHDQKQAGFMSWDQLRELAQNGGTIANHTVSHPYLLERRSGQDDRAWRAWVSAEIVEAGQRIQQETGTEVKLLAYPFGEYNEAILEIAAALGYSGFGQQSGPLARFSDLRVLPRFPFGGAYGDRQDFAVKVNSLPLPLASGTDSIRWESADRTALHDVVLQGPTARPVLGLLLADDFDLATLRCFVTGQNQARIMPEPPWAFVQSERPLARGRSRYNCTAQSGQSGRYHWFSQLWIVQ